MDHARFCRWVVFRGVPGINNVITGAVRALCENAPLACAMFVDYMLVKTQKNISARPCTGWATLLPLTIEPPARGVKATLLCRVILKNNPQRKGRYQHLKGTRHIVDHPKSVPPKWMPMLPIATI